MNPLTNIWDEEAILIGLCRLEFSEVHLKKIRALLSTIQDWNYFGRLANYHGVAALTYYNIENFNLSKYLPEEVLEFLRNSMMKNLARNEFNGEIMREVLSLLTKKKSKRYF